MKNLSFSLEEERDRCVWKLEASGVFSLSSSYEFIRPQGAVRPMLRWVWDSKESFDLLLACVKWTLAFS